MTSLKDACARKIVELKTMTATRKCTLLDMWSNASKKSKDSCSSDRHDTVENITMPECVTVADQISPSRKEKVLLQLQLLVRPSRKL